MTSSVWLPTLNGCNLGMIAASGNGGLRDPIARIAQAAVASGSGRTRVISKRVLLAEAKTHGRTLGPRERGSLMVS